MSVIIDSIRCEPLSVPLVDPFIIATGRVDATRSVLITAIVSENGRSAEGLGEASCLRPVTKEDQPEAIQAIEQVAPGLAGRSFDDWAQLHPLLDGPFAGFPVARSGVEMAILDALARVRGLPLYRLLSDVDRAPQVETDITLPILSPQRMAQLAADWWAKGFRSFKVKVGRALNDDLDALRAIAAIIPEARFRVDANGGYSAEAALRFLDEAHALGLKVECFEQPCQTDDLDGMAKVSTHTSVPVIADESVKTVEQLEKVRARNAARGVNLKVAKSGGLLRAYDVGAAAKKYGMLVMVGGMVETRLGMTAATHLVAALGGVEFPDLDTAWLLQTDPFKGGYREDGPRYTLGEEPGLGVTRA